MFWKNKHFLWNNEQGKINIFGYAFSILIELYLILNLACV